VASFAGPVPGSIQAGESRCIRSLKAAAPRAWRGHVGNRGQSTLDPLLADVCRPAKRNYIESARKIQSITVIVSLLHLFSSSIKKDFFQGCLAGQTKASGPYLEIDAHWRKSLQVECAQSLPNPIRHERAGRPIHAQMGNAFVRAEDADWVPA
jgi:hypothetical protein